MKKKFLTWFVPSPGSPLVTRATAWGAMILSGIGMLIPILHFFIASRTDLMVSFGVTFLFMCAMPLNFLMFMSTGGTFFKNLLTSKASEKSRHGKAYLTAFMQLILNYLVMIPACLAMATIGMDYLTVHNDSGVKVEQIVVFDSQRNEAKAVAVESGESVMILSPFKSEGPIRMRITTETGNFENVIYDYNTGLAGIMTVAIDPGPKIVVIGDGFRNLGETTTAKKEGRWKPSRF